MKKIAFSILGALFFPLANADAQEYGVTYPVVLSDANTKVTFEVDSTWHLIQGQVSGLHGEARLENEMDQDSVIARIVFPVEKFDTHNSMRDSRMMEVMAQEVYPEVVFTLNRLPKDCALNRLVVGTPCESTAQGQIEIHGVSKPIALYTEIVAEDTLYRIHGVASLHWPDFGVEDPSILVAKLDKEVKVAFDIEVGRVLKGATTP